MRWLLLILALIAGPLRAGGADGWTAVWAPAQMVPAGDQVVPTEWLGVAPQRAEAERLIRHMSADRQR